MPPGGQGPYGIVHDLSQTRVFIPLHALSESASGAFKVKFYSTGSNPVGWFVAGISNFGSQDRQTPVVLAVAQKPINIVVGNGKPAIVVRDSYAPDIATAGAKIESPKKRIVSNSNEFELQVFDKFYRVYNLQTGDLVIEHAGINPNFSPTSRFIGAFAEGSGFEIVDLYTDSVVATSGALNRHGGYEGTAHLAAWSRNDAVVALSFWGYGGIYVQQTLVDGPGVGNGGPSCHACQGIGITLSMSYETGIVAWSGQSQGWASLFERAASSQQAQAQAEQEIPLPPDDSTNFDKQQALQQKLSSEYLSGLGRRYLFDADAFWNALPKDPDVFRTDGTAWDLGDKLQLSHACTQDAGDDCSSLGEDSAEGRAKLKLLASKRVEHRSLKKDGDAPKVQSADARLFSVRALARFPAQNQDRNIWLRMEQLGVPLRAGDRVEAPVESFTWEEVHEKPASLINKLASKIPAIRQILVTQKDNLDIPDYADEQHEIKKINPAGVRYLASWNINGTAYWLIHEDYKQNNVATPNQQYLHLVSGNSSGLFGIIDLSTRLGTDGTLSKSTDQDTEELLDHPWPSDFDIVTIVSGRFLLASGHWLLDNARWGLAYDLKENKTLFFNGQLPNATATKSLSITNNGKLFIVVNSNGQLYFYNTDSGKQVLSGYYVDDELVIYDPHGYYMSTYEGSQFVFLKFPGLPGYLPFKQFAKTLSRPDIIIKGMYFGTEGEAEPELSPPPRLALATQASLGTPGALHLAITINSTRELARLLLFVDGQLWNERAIGGRELGIEEDVFVPAQSRWLTAVAVDSSGSESVPTAVDIPRDHRPSTRKLFVAAIGTNTYLNLPRDQQLRFAVDDARKFVSAIKTQNSGYYEAVESATFLDARGLKKELPKKLRWISQAAAQDDTIMLFVSGHGYRDPSNNRLYLVLAETELHRLEETSLSWDEVAQTLDGTKARIIVFIDACHSGAIPNGGTNDEITGALSNRQVRFTVIAAAKGRQESIEKEARGGGGGIFTSAVVGAITRNRAAIDTNRNGVIELSELYGKVKPGVLAATQGKQTPWLARVDMVGEVPLF